MKKARLLLGLLMCGTMYGQGVRYDNNVITSANSAPPGSQTTLYTVPFSVITVCSYPAAGNPCTNTVPIYQDRALTIPATNPITSDVHGRFGFWVAAGTYAYNITSPAGTNFGNFALTLGGSGGGSSITLQHNGTALANQSILNFNDTTPTAPTGNVNVTFQNDSSGKLSAYVPISGSGITLTTLGTTGAATLGSGVLNIPDYTYSLTVPKVTALGTLTNDILGSAAKIGGVSVTGTPSTGQGIVATSGTTATWQTSPGGLTGQTATCAPKAATATTSTSSLPICDDGTTTTVTHPVAINDGSGAAGSLSLGQGTAIANGTTAVTLTVPTSVTSYRLQVPGVKPVGSNTYLSCTAADPAVCSWAAGGGGGGTLPSGSGIPTIQTGTTWGPTIPLIPVEAYGAVGNASCASAADSTTAIQNAINALPATGGMILLQPLCYRVSGTLTFNSSFTGIKGFSGFVYFGGSRIESTSASADIISVAGASSASIISRNRFEDFAVQRSVNPTGTAKGISLEHVGSTILDHIGSGDSIYAYYLHDARGVTANQTLAGFGNNGFSETTGTYYGFYVDTADGLPSNSFITNNDGVACNTGTGATTYGFYLTGAAINDHQHTGFNIGGNCSYGVVIDYTGAGAALTAYDIHFWGSILDAYRTNAIKVMNVPASATASIEFNGGWTNGTGTAIDIETSAGVSVSNMQINCASCTNAALVNASTGFVFNTNEWIGAPTTHLALTGSSNGSVTGNNFAHAATNGISADATSSSNAGFQTNTFGSGVTNTIVDTGSNPMTIQNTATSGGILQRIFSPNITSGNFVANFVGTAFGDGVVYAWRNNTVHNASLETWGSGFPIRLAGSVLGLEGGNVYVGNANSTASNTQPSGGGLFNVGSSNQFQVDSSGNAKVAGGSNILYRCTTAGALPVGALTINTGNCGASADTGLRVN